MNIVKRRRAGLSRPIALVAVILVPMAAIALGIAAWSHGGEQPITDQTIAVPLPAVSK